MPAATRSSNRFPLGERIANIILGINVCGWAVLVIVAAPEEQKACSVRWCIAGLHGVAGTLFLFRRPLLQAGGHVDLAWAIPSILLSGAALSHAPGCNQWATAPQVLFVAGTGLAMVSLLALGRNFAVLPAVRGMTSRGPYRIVRHPIYAGELLLVAACFAARADLIGGAILVGCIAAVAIRILVEESLLRRQLDNLGTEYEQYCAGVRFRVIPGVW